MLMPESLKARLELALQLAPALGEIASRYFRGGFRVETKPDSTLVTSADKEIEERVEEGIRRRFSSDGILGEEFGDRPGSSGFRWLVDPIDGTHNFVRRIPLFAILMGIEQEGEVAAGVIHSPEMHETYWAAQGQGAFLNQQPIRVSEIAGLSRAHVLYPSFSKLAGDPRFKRALFKLAEQAFRSRGFGDYYGHVLVASGRSEMMMEPNVSPWDVAPIKILVEEAGGIFTDLQGSKTIYGSGAVSANRFLHPCVMAALKD
ncbi:MAG: histidinol phosphate phosphatase [Planctomycetes bacterium]|nr:histidinol phosphate phosphatase [Planctomycetota bacterium]